MTRRRTARTVSGIQFSGYEIHMGTTISQSRHAPFAILDDGSEDGMSLPGIAGTYLHGALENREVLEEFLGCSLGALPSRPKTEHYDRLATWFAENVNQVLFERRYLRRESRSIGYLSHRV
jgi:adenosylcobyric acid synthase